MPKISHLTIIESGIQAGSANSKPWLGNLQLLSSKFLSGLGQFTFQDWVYSAWHGRDYYALCRQVKRMFSDWWNYGCQYSKIHVKWGSSGRVGFISLEERKVGHWVFEGPTWKEPSSLERVQRGDQLMCQNTVPLGPGFPFKLWRRDKQLHAVEAPHSWMSPNQVSIVHLSTHTHFCGEPQCAISILGTGVEYSARQMGSPQSCRLHFSGDNIQ